MGVLKLFIKLPRFSVRMLPSIKNKPIKIKKEIKQRKSLKLEIKIVWLLNKKGCFETNWSMKDPND